MDIQWSKIGSAELPAEAKQIGHQLIIDRVQHEDTGHYRCTGRLKGEISIDDAALTISRLGVRFLAKQSKLRQTIIGIIEISANNLRNPVG